MEEVLECLWPLWEILRLKGEGGSAAVMKGRYLLIWVLLDVFSHSLSSPLLSDIIVQD